MDLGVEPRRYSKLRLAFFRAVEGACALAGGRRLYRARHLSPGRFLVRRERVRVFGLPAGLAGFRIAHLSDLHGGRFLGAGDLRAVVRAANELEPDLCVVTGDFITHHHGEVLPLVDELAALRSTHGTLAVFGNHDYKDRAEARISAALAPAGVRFLRNACERLEVDGGALAVVGLEDLEEGRKVDLARARAGLRAGDVEVVLCHNPAGAQRLARPGCAAVLSGHTHGTQVDLPFLRDLGPPHPGLRVELGETTLIVSRGLGAVGLPVRIGAPAELVVLELA
ncbi:MAG: metallophosphoesterase [Planctomycetota bacterium]|nr:metallophosphoesterase [Planctomycetota bacterium]MDP6762039.1 metallophosphoesterase [Planctomycetota bacterium]MDP6989222.1 metallophosphoesterase [Planctomycetota bacterium]